MAATARQHARHHGARQRVGARYMRVHQLPELGLFGILNRLLEVVAGVVHEVRDRAEALFQSRHKVPRPGRVGDVKDREVGRRAQVRGGAGQLLFASSNQHHARTGGDKRVGHGTAEPGRSACDQGRFPSQRKSLGELHH